MLRRRKLFNNLIRLLILSAVAIGISVNAQEDVVNAAGGEEKANRVVVQQNEPEHVDDTSVLSQWTLKYAVGFAHAFVASISVIIVSELGDKTFFIAAIMAMRHSRLVIFAAAISALFVMTVLSVFLGFATTVIPRIYTYYASTILFAVFGVKMLREGWNMSADEGQEELEQVQAELKKKDEELQDFSSSPSSMNGDVETGVIKPRVFRRKSSVWCNFLSPIFVQAFTLTFLAEWGDRSQLTTIILAARENPIGVAFGGTLGHAICTSIAVIGGRLIAQRISVKTVTLIGGAVFIAFAVTSLLFDPSS
eukprot:m.311007 g.311007  ORF g.311007 m.311007 type:complete len:308 (+) comp57912_c0_seq1:62-985(+)